MSWKRSAAWWLPIALYLFLIAWTTFGAPDFSWLPSYFDDDDDDIVFVLLGNEAPFLPVPAVTLLPLLAAFATVVLLTPSARSLLAPSRSRLRAPPLP